MPAFLAKPTISSGFQSTGLKSLAILPYQSLKIPAKDCICSIYPSLTGSPLYTPPYAEYKPKWINIEYFWFIHFCDGFCCAETIVEIKNSVTIVLKRLIVKCGILQPKRQLFKSLCNLVYHNI